MLEQIAETPVGPRAAARSVVHRWRHLLPQFRPGYLTRLARFNDRGDRSPRLAFAGDYLVAPTVEGALTSGMRAAADVLRGLDAG